MRAVFRLFHLIVHTIKGLIKLTIYFRSFSAAPSPLTARQQQMICRWMTEALNILNIKTSINGKRDETASLMIANHISWLDILLIGSQHPIRFIAKNEIASWPVIKTLVRNSGSLFIKRGSSFELKVLSKTISQIIKYPENIVFFPEGKTTDGKQIEKFYPGLFQTAIDNQIKIQPLLLIYSDHDRPSKTAPYINEQSLWESLWNILKSDKIKAELHWCDAIEPASLNRKKLAQLTHTILADKLKSELYH